MSEQRKRVVQRLRMMRQFGRTAPRKRVPRQRHPFHLELEYGNRLVGYVDRIHTAANTLLSELPRLAESIRVRHDAHEADKVHALINEIRSRILSREQLGLVVATFANRVATHQRSEYARQVKAALGVDMHLLGVDVQLSGARLADFVAENVSLIRTRTATMTLDEVEQVIVHGFAAGARHEEIAKEIEKRFDVARSRARLIARDQVGKLNAQVGRDANKQIGIDRFRWRSMRDNAVRPEHQHYDRRSEREPFSYSGENGYRPPTLPGQDVQCRCYDEAVFDDLLGEL